MENGVGLQFSAATAEIMVPGREAFAATCDLVHTTIFDVLIIKCKSKLSTVRVQDPGMTYGVRSCIFIFRESQPYPLCPSSEQFNTKDPYSALKSWHRSIDKIMSDATFTTGVSR